MAADMAEEQQIGKELYQGKYRIKSARASWYNYNEGLYFITICTADKRHFFGEIKGAEMLFSEIGKYAQHCILQIEQLHQDVVVPYSVVMPNHVHMIISITTDRHHADNGVVYADVETPQCDVSTVNKKMQKIANHCGRLSHLITQFKYSVTRYARHNAIEFGWQSRFHDHIIRNQDELQRISDYIQNNVNRWDSDCFNRSV